MYKKGSSMFYVSSINAVNPNKNKSLTTTRPDKRQSIGFSGHKIVENDHGERLYNFYLPNARYNDAKVELVRLLKDKNGNIIDVENINEDGTGRKYQIPLDRNNKAVFNPKDSDVYLGSEDDDFILGYRFIVDGKPYTDNLQNATVDGETYNIAQGLYASSLKGPQTMYHVVPYNMNPKGENKKVRRLGEDDFIEFNTNNWRSTHYTNYGGTIRDIADAVPYIKSVGAKNIMTTPLFASGPLPIGYWTNNAYQLKPSLGTEKDYKDLVVDLYKNGMGLILDGAFVNEGLEGIHLIDVHKYGANSPYYNWFEFFGNENEPIGYGVLPLDETAKDNWDIRIINSPRVWNVDENGMPRATHGAKNESYDPTQPTYIQLFDRRLTSVEQLDRQKLFDKYDIANVEDPNEIKDYMDGVQPYKFQVSAEELEQKFRKYEDADEFKYSLLDWDKFSLTTSNKDRKANLWVGNKDIAKLRFMTPQDKLAEIYENAGGGESGALKVAAVKKAEKEVQDYIVGIGEYWTRKTSNIINSYNAQQLQGAKTVDEYKAKIKEAVEKGKLPQSVLSLSNPSDKTLENYMTGDYDYYNIPAPVASIEEGLKAFPLESIEFSPELTSILGSPVFKKLAEDRIYNGALKAKTIEVLGMLDRSDKTGRRLLSGDRLNYNNAEVYDLISDDITKFLIVNALTDSYFDNDDHQDVQRLNQISLNSLDIKGSSHEEVARKLVARLEEGLNSININKLQPYVEYLEKDVIKGASAEDLRVAKLLSDKAQAGLNWRIDAAKDIADIESIGTKANSEECMDAIISFWNKFNKGVDKYNKHAYKIGEFTDAGILASGSPKYPNAGTVEEKFVEDSGFTTQTNYNYQYSILHGIYGGFPELGSGEGGYNAPIGKLTEKLLYAWNGSPGFLFSGPKYNVNNSHVAGGNHDKPRIHHGFALNSKLAYASYMGSKLEPSVTDELKDMMEGSEFYTPYIEEAVRINDEISKLYEKEKEGELTGEQRAHLVNLKEQERLSVGNRLFKIVSPEALAMEAAILDAVKQTLPENTPEKYMTQFIQTVDDMAKIRNNGEYFAVRGFQDNWKDILNAMPEGAAKEFFSTKVKEADVEEAFLKPAMIKGDAMYFLKALLPGTPTLFSGDELGLTGFESKSKNQYLQNRGRGRFEYIGGMVEAENRNRKNPEYRKYAEENVKEVSRALNLRLDESLSPLVDGETIVLKSPANPEADGYEGHGHQHDQRVFGLYRYNDKTDVIALASNEGFSDTRRVNPQKVTLDKIDMSHGYVKPTASDKEDKFDVGLPFKLEEGTVYVDAYNPESKTEYVVNKDGDIVNKEEGKPIEFKEFLILKRKA